MYIVKYNDTQLTDLPLERANVYKKRLRKRGIKAEVIEQDSAHEDCKDGVCGLSWHPVKQCNELAV